MKTTGAGLWRRNRKLAARLLRLCGKTPPILPADSEERERLTAADAVVTHIEINDRHGVGVLLGRLFAGCGKLITIRSQDHFGGNQKLGDVRLKIEHGGADRPRVFENVLAALEGHTVARILAVPYYADDARNAVALQAISGAPMCTYLMDDQNLWEAGIPDAWMAELLEASRLRLAISPEMAAGYEAKYGLKFWWMPPVVEPDRILRRLELPPLKSETPWGVIVGNIWGRHWFERLRGAVRGAGVQLYWYARSHFQYFEADPSALERDSIVVADEPLDDDELIALLRRAPFAVVPTGTLEASDDRRSIAALSLPSRIPFILATAHTPLLVLGSHETAAARFVAESGTGLVCPYDREAFRQAVARLLEPRRNAAMRRRAFELAPLFSGEGALDWIWRSLERGRPADDRFERLRAALEARPAGRQIEI
jgi:hypothetical protein